MTYDPILAAIQATKYAESIMRRTAGEMSPEDAVNLPDPSKAVRIPLDESHTDWRPRWGDKSTTEKWHPPYGETHVKYHVYQVGGGRNPTLWRANHHGTYEGMQTLSPPNGSGEDLTFPNYTMSADPEPVGERRNFRNPKDAKAAAEAHYRDNYGQPPKHDYDIDSIMDKHPQAPSGGKSGLGDDEDYSRIFDAVRRALKRAGMALRRTAGDVPLWGDWKREDPRHETSNPDGTAEGYRADINDDHHMRVFRKNPSATYADDDISPEAMAESWYPHPVNMDTPWSYHVHGVGQNDNPYLKFHTPYDDNPHHTGFPDMETAQRAAESAYKTFAPGGHGPSSPDPDEHLDPNDPRIIGAGLHARYAAAISGVSDAVAQRIAAELSPPCPDCGQVAGFDEHMVSPRVKVCRNCDYPMTDIGHDGLLEGILRGHDKAVGDLPGTDHPSLGKHGALDDDPMPDDPNQLEMFTPVPVKPDPRWSGNAILCRNCGHPKSHHGYGARKMGPCPTNRRNDGILPRTRWAKHGGLSYEDTMKLIDDQLAAGEPKDRSDHSTDYSEGGHADYSTDYSERGHKPAESDYNQNNQELPPLEPWEKEILDDWDQRNNPQPPLKG